MVSTTGELLNWKDVPIGRFHVEIELANAEDITRAKIGNISPEQVRRMTIRAMVDTGATRLVLPEAVVAQLGLARSGTIGVRYADQRTASRELAQNIQLTLLGRSSVFNAIVEPLRDTALLGAIVLEDLDFMVDCTNQRLVPRDPKQIISEIE